MECELQLDSHFFCCIYEGTLYGTERAMGICFRYIDFCFLRFDTHSFASLVYGASMLYIRASSSGTVRPSVRCIVSCMAGYLLGAYTPESICFLL